ncbi:MAG: hypothetical protein RL470_769 [Actinomycetota bacterium]
MQSGASDFTPEIFSRSSVEEPTLSGAASIFTSCTFFSATGAAGTNGATGAAGVTAAYSPVSKCRTIVKW